MIAVDRIEGQRAVLEIGGEIVEVPRSALPEGAREGDLLVWHVADASERLAAAEARLDRLRARDPGSDEIDL